MSKKLITACMALVSLAAFALPATASATNDPELLCTKGGATCPVGTKIIGHNIGELLMTDINKKVLTQCSTAFMTGELTKNSGTAVEGTISTADFGGTGTKAAGAVEPECTGSFGNITVTTGPFASNEGTPWCLKSDNTMATDEFQVRGNACSGASRSIEFILDSTTVGECKYTRTTAIPGTYTTEATGDAIMSIFEQRFPKSAGGFLCPSEGYLDLTFTLEKDTDATAEKTTNTTTHPLYIS